MKNSTTAPIHIGDEVEVSFKGTVVQRDDTNFNHIAVSANGYIHHVHRYSNDVVKVVSPHPDVELGQVWSVGTDQGNRTFLVYVDNRDHGGNVVLVGTNMKNRTYGEGYKKMLYSPEELFTEFPGATLILNADGSDAGF